MNPCKTIFVIALLILTSSCGNHLNIEDVFKNESAFTLNIHSLDKNPLDGLVSKTIDNDSEIIIKLKSWLKNHSEGWKISIASWATPDISLIGNDFRLLVFKDFAVIGFQDKYGNQVQYTRQIEKSDFAFLIEKASPQMDNFQNPIKYDTSKTAIISWDKASNYPFDTVSSKRASFTQDDLAQIDSLFTACVTTYNNSLSPGHDDYKIDLKTGNHKKQLLVVSNLKGEKEVFVNCFCDEWDKSRRSEILIVEDGGPCYFRFKVNLTTKKTFDLQVNGFG